MTEPLGFLSYTRRDDQFFGGYITKFREALEAGVQVVTGDRGFKLFQDIEGIVIGEQWEKKLAEVIGRASFFLPMLSPLFLSSPNCREEVELFVGRERASGRDDMILPVYLVDSPKLEKAEERDRDPVATEIAKRQRYDWRENAWLPLDQPAARRAVLTLAQAIATAMERIATPAPGSRGGPAGAVGLEFGARRRRGPPRSGSRPSAGRRAWSGPPSVWSSGSTTTPTNNAWERAALESYGVRFTLARSTSEALGLMAPGRFAAIVSDLGRAGEPKAGLDLLQRLRDGGSTEPYFLYTSARAAKALNDVEGAQGVTADPDQLVAMVIAAVR